LVSAGHEVTAVSRRPTDEPGFATVDLESPDAATQLPDQQFDVLVHFASYVPLNEGASTWPECYERNVLSTAHLLSWAVPRVRRMLVASSCAVYGADKLYAPTDEGHPLRPDTAYALSKYAQEQLLQAASRLHAIPLVMLRLGYVYGPGLAASKAVVRMLMKIANGEPLLLTNSTTAGLHLVHVDDIARIGEALLDQGYGVFNLAAGRHVSLREYAETAARVLGRSTEISYADDTEAPVTNWYSGQLLHERYGLRPSVSLADGIASMAAPLGLVGGS
jgi:UDP-glucose 4-epimerase